MQTRDNTPSPAVPHAAHEGHGVDELAGVVPPQLSIDERLTAIETKLAELVAALSTISTVAGLVGNAIQTEGIAGLVKALPALMRGA